MDRIYFDHAATTPVDPQVIEAMLPFFNEKFGNATSPHFYGQEAQNAVEQARSVLAGAIGAKPKEIIFNSGATEGANHVLLGFARAQKAKGNHIIISSVEHHCVEEPCQKLRDEGFHITFLKVDSDGLVNPEDVKKSIIDKTILIATIHANNEIGVIQPVEEIGRIAKERGVPFFVDAVQTVGHIPVDVNQLNADFLICSAHKFYGPKGIGALFAREGTKLPKYILGGDQERGLRASTVNVPGIVGLAKALELSLSQMDEDILLQTQLRNKLIDGVLASVEGVKLNGHRFKRLPNNAHFAFKRVQGESLLMSLDMIGIAASMGSACKSGAMEVSHVLRAIGLDDELADGALRITLGRSNTEAHIDFLLSQLPDLVSNLRI